MPLLFKVINDKIIVRGEKMLYLDLLMYIHSLSAETKIIIFQLSFLTFEIAYFFWLRKYFNEEEKRIREYYR